MRRSALAISVLAVLAGAWTALWAYAAHEASRQLDDWLVSEAAQGRHWTCPDRRTEGYPFALGISCAHPTFAGQALGANVQASVAALQAEVGLFHPTRVTLSLAAPFVYRSSEQAVDLRGRWSALQVDLDGLPDLSNVSLAGTDIVVDGSFGAAGRQSLPAARLAASFAVPKPGPHPLIGFDIAVAGVDLPQIDELTGDTKPANLVFRGSLNQPDVGDVRTPEEAMEQWRQAGGVVTFTDASIAREVSLASATGTLGLDPLHRAAGHLDAEFLGLEPILQRYGLNPKLVAAGGLLSHLLGGGGAKPPTHPGAIAMPVTLRDGFLSVGPIRTSVALPPLY